MKEKCVPAIYFIIPEIKTDKKWSQILEDFTCLNKQASYNIKHKRKPTKKLIKLGKNIILRLKRLYKKYPCYQVAIYRAIANCYQFIGEYEKSELYYTRTINLAPYLPVIKEEISDLYKWWNRWNEATRCLAEILIAYPKKLNYLINRLIAIDRRKYTVDKHSVLYQNLKKYKNIKSK